MSKNMLVIDGKVTKFWKNEAPRPSNGVIQGSTEFNDKIYNHEMPFSVWPDKADQIEEGKAYELIGSINRRNYKDKDGNWQSSIDFFPNKITEIDPSTVKRATFESAEEKIMKKEMEAPEPEPEDDTFGDDIPF